MTVLAIRPVEHQQRRQQAARHCLAQDAGKPSGPNCRVGDPHHLDTNASKTRTWLRAEMTQSTTAISAAWEERPTINSVWKRRREHPHANCGARTNDRRDAPWWVCPQALKER